MSGKFSRMLSRSTLLLIALSLCLAPVGVSGFADDKPSASDKPASSPLTDSDATRDLQNQERPRRVTPDLLAMNEPVARVGTLHSLFTAPRADTPSLPAGNFSPTLLRQNLLALPVPKPEFVAPVIPSLPPYQDAGRASRLGVVSAYVMLEYRRDEMKYTGNPTLTGVFPEPVPIFSVPDAPIFFLPGAFEPNDEQLLGYASVRVKDYGFENLRFSTEASFRYSGDLDGTTNESTFIGMHESFVGRRILEPLTVFTDISHNLTDDRLTKLNVRVGRQFIYGADPIRIDGGTVTINHPRFDLDVFGGRRVTFFSDPEARGVFGQNLLVRATSRTSFGYDLLFYDDDISHRFHIGHNIGESWVARGNFFMIDDSPVDLGFELHYLPPGANTRMAFNFLQKLSSDDFIYDHTYRTFARNPENQIRRRFFPLPPTGDPENGNGRLNLFEINPYTQFYLDVYHNLSQKFGVGGSVWVRHVNDKEDRGPFDNSFQEYRISADYFPTSAFEASGEYRYRNLSRPNADQAREFDDIRREGETRFHEIYANAAYNFFNNRLAVEGGLFYRRLNLQSRLIDLDGLDTTGFTGGIKWRIARGYRLLLEYGIDDELPFFNPDIDYTQSFRVRFEWHFSR